MMRCVTAMLVAVSLFATVAARGDDAAAAAVIEGFDAALLSVMKDAKALGYQGRYDRLAPVLQRTFDFEFMSRFVIGTGWQDLTPADQQRWTAAFTQATIATYAGRFTGWGGEQFKMLGQEAAPQDTLFVKTMVDRPDAEDVELTYRMRKTDAGWRVVDVYQKGTVSELALRRSEYSAVLKRDGFEKLLLTVAAKTADYASGKLTQ
ncbi:MAG: ABC transporter substrate-binding protein [bacterium]